MNTPIPTLTTTETQRLRSDYPSIEHLEAGNVAAWLVERQEQLLVRAKDERTGMNLAKLLTLAGGAVGAICYATSPLAPIGALIAGVGYVWAIAQDLNDSHQFAPVPFVRGNFIEFLSAMGDKDARDEWFSNQNELVDLMFHLDPFERYEFGMLKEHAHVLSDYLTQVEAGKRFYAYRWLYDWFVNLRGTFPSRDQLTSHLVHVTPDPRIDSRVVEAIREAQTTQRPYVGIPPTPVADLPETPIAELPQTKTVNFDEVEGSEAKSDTLETPAVEVQTPEPQPEPETTPQVLKTQPPNLGELRQLPLEKRAIALLSHLSNSGFDVARAIADQITCICGNQRGGKGTLMAILAILSCAVDPKTKVHYFTAGDDIYPFRCDKLYCRLTYPNDDGEAADAKVANALYGYLKEMDNGTQGAYNDIILVIDEAVALSDYLDAEQKQWIIRFLLTRASKKGAQIFIVLHGVNLTSWVGTGNAGGFSSTFKTGATFIGCEATSKKINPLRSISVATGRYFIANPDDFSKSVAGGDLGIVPEWLKSEVNPSTGQPDPARTTLTFFPELTDLRLGVTDSNSDETPSPNLSETDPSTPPSPEATLPERKVPPSNAEESRKPCGISMEAALAQLAEALQAEASDTGKPLMDGLEPNGKLLMLRALLSKNLGKEKTILLAWGQKSGGRNHEKYKYMAEVLERMIEDLNSLGFSEENNWGINA